MSGGKVVVEVGCFGHDQQKKSEGKKWSDFKEYSGLAHFPQKWHSSESEHLIFKN